MREGIGKRVGLAVVCLSLVSALGLGGCSTSKTDVSATAADTDETVQTESSVETYGSLGTFEATTLDRESFTQDDVAAKDVTVINFWQISCQPCIKEMPKLEALAEALPDNVQIVTYCSNGLGNKDSIESINQKTGWEGLTLVNAEGGLRDLTYEIEYTPTTVFVASDGTLVGEMLVGSPSNLGEAYLEGINAVLEWSGKPALDVDVDAL